MAFATTEQIRQLAADELEQEGTFEADVVLKVKPTLVRLSRVIVTGETAWLMGMDPEMWSEMYRRDGVPYRIGVTGEGWYPVEEITLPRDPGGGADPAVAGWARLRLGVLEPLPPYMILSSYDIGHPVVVTTGEYLGATGMVEDIRRESVILNAGASHRFDAVGAIRTGTRHGDARLAPLKVLQPKGSRVWVRMEDGSWEEALISDYPDSSGYPKVELWLPGRKEIILRDRDRREFVDGTEPKPKPEPTRVRRSSVRSSKSPFIAGPGIR